MKKKLPKVPMFKKVGPPILVTKPSDENSSSIRDGFNEFVKLVHKEKPSNIIFAVPSLQTFAGIIGDEIMSRSFFEKLSSERALPLKLSLEDKANNTIKSLTVQAHAWTAKVDPKIGRCPAFVTFITGSNLKNVIRVASSLVYVPTIRQDIDDASKELDGAIYI